MEILLQVIGYIIFGVTTSYLTYFITKKFFASDANVLIEQAKGRAKAIEYEAEKILNEHKIKVKEQEIALQQDYERKISALEKREYNLNRTIERDRQNLDAERQKLRIPSYTYLLP